VARRGGAGETVHEGDAALISAADRQRQRARGGAPGGNSRSQKTGELIPLAIPCPSRTK
jgi:hypothetical protein